MYQVLLSAAASRPYNTTSDTKLKEYLGWGVQSLRGLCHSLHSHKSDGVLESCGVPLGQWWGQRGQDGIRHPMFS